MENLLLDGNDQELSLLTSNNRLFYVKGTWELVVNIVLRVRFSVLSFLPGNDCS